jgi:hypothetical protein
MQILHEQLFSLGQILATPALLGQITRAEIEVGLDRHAFGDWGDLDPDDASENERALADGSRIFSAFTSGQGIKFWIITEADRSSTTVLLPSDY